MICVRDFVVAVVVKIQQVPWSLRTEITYVLTQKDGAVQEEIQDNDPSMHRTCWIQENSWAKIRAGFHQTPSCSVLWQESISMKIFLRRTQTYGVWLLVFIFEIFLYSVIWITFNSERLSALSSVWLEPRCGRGCVCTHPSSLQSGESRAAGFSFTSYPSPFQSAIVSPCELQM